MRRQEAGMLQSRTDIGDGKDVVEIEPVTERNFGDEAAVKSSEGEALDSLSDR